MFDCWQSPQSLITSPVVNCSSLADPFDLYSPEIYLWLGKHMQSKQQTVLCSLMNHMRTCQRINPWLQRVFAYSTWPVDIPDGTNKKYNKISKIKTIYIQIPDFFFVKWHGYANVFFTLICKVYIWPKYVRYLSCRSHKLIMKSNIDVMTTYLLPA